jgi:hypothetical protein
MMHWTINADILWQCYSMGYTIKVQRFADLPSILCDFKSLYKHFGMMLGRSFFFGGLILLNIVGIIIIQEPGNVLIQARQNRMTLRVLITAQVGRCLRGKKQPT